MMVPVVVGSCDIYPGYINPAGYGGGGGGRKRAHVVAWEAVNGPVPRGLQLDHLCRVKSCRNPDHLEPVTQRENIRRAYPDICKYGHSLSVRKRGDRERRHCRTCDAALHRAKRAARWVA